MTNTLKEDIINALKLAQDALHMATLPFPIDEVKTMRALQAVSKVLDVVAAAERNKLAQWMMAKGYATGHGDTVEDLLQELDWQITESWSKVVMASVEAEREACAKVCEKQDGEHDHIYAAAIRARTKGEINT